MPDRYGQPALVPAFRMSRGGTHRIDVRMYHSFMPCHVTGSPAGISACAETPNATGKRIGAKVALC